MKIFGNPDVNMNENSRKAPVILVVDDEPSIIRALSRILRHGGFEVLAASSGNEALDITRNSHIDMVLCDIRMPEMNGISLLSIISEENPEIIRTVLTGYMDVNSVIDSINRGHIARFFIKPWNNEDLVREIRELLGKPDGGLTRKGDL